MRRSKGQNIQQIQLAMQDKVLLTQSETLNFQT